MKLSVNAIEGRARSFLAIGLIASASACGGGSSGGGAVAPPIVVLPAVSATPWPEANALFERDPAWIGGDAAYSIDLGAGRILWLFGDSFIATTPARKRTEAKVIRNSIAIQQGSNPSTASAQFSWHTVNGQPASFFPEANGDWFWPGHGARVGSGLLLFLIRERASTAGLGFSSVGSVCLFIDNPDDPPLNWHSREVALTPTSFAMVGAGAVLSDAQYLYSYSPREPGNHDVFLVRWPKAQAALGNLSKPEWWSAAGWTAQAALIGEPKILFANGQTEFSVSPGPNGTLREVQSSGFGATDIILRSAAVPEGPWSAPKTIYHPPESDRANAMVYAAKAHPELQGADMVVTYVANNSVFATVLADMSLYYPRFVRIPNP